MTNHATRLGLSTPTNAPPFIIAQPPQIPAFRSCGVAVFVYNYVFLPINRLHQAKAATDKVRCWLRSAQLMDALRTPRRVMAIYIYHTEVVLQLWINVMESNNCQPMDNAYDSDDKDVTEKRWAKSITKCLETNMLIGGG